MPRDASTRTRTRSPSTNVRCRRLRDDSVARGSIVQKIADRRQALGWIHEANASYGAAADVFRAAGEYEREAACRVEAALTAYRLDLAEPTVPLEAMLGRLDASEYRARSRVHLGLAWFAASFWFPTRARHHLDHVDERALRRPRTTGCVSTTSRPG